MLPMEGGLGWLSGQGIRSYVSQRKILHATTKTWLSQINKYFLKRSSLEKMHFNLHIQNQWDKINIQNIGIWQDKHCVYFSWMC